MTHRVALWILGASCQSAFNLEMRKKGMLLGFEPVPHGPQNPYFIVKVGLRIHLTHRDMLLCDSGGTSTVP